MRTSWRPGRQTPKVRGGRVQKKNRWDSYVAKYDEVPRNGEIPIVFEGAVRGHRHPVSEADLRKFIGIIPDWSEHAQGLRCLVLGPGADGSHGWSDEGVICLNAWSGYLVTWYDGYFEEHRRVVEALMIPCRHRDDGEGYDVDFTKETARGFQLMHVFLHELGHHIDRMATRRQLYCPRGEAFAEEFANKTADGLWDSYFRVFG